MQWKGAHQDVGTALERQAETRQQQAIEPGLFCPASSASFPEKTVRKKQRQHGMSASKMQSHLTGSTLVPVRHDAERRCRMLFFLSETRAVRNGAEHAPGLLELGSLGSSATPKSQRLVHVQGLLVTRTPCLARAPRERIGPRRRVQNVTKPGPFCFSLSLVLIAVPRGTELHHIPGLGASANLIHLTRAGH